MQLTLEKTTCYNIVPKMSLVQSPASIQENLPLEVPIDNSPDDESIMKDENLPNKQNGFITDTDAVKSKNKLEKEIKILTENITDNACDHNPLKEEGKTISEEMGVSLENVLTEDDSRQDIKKIESSPQMPTAEIEESDKKDDEIVNGKNGNSIEYKKDYNKEIEECESRNLKTADVETFDSIEDETDARTKLNLVVLNPDSEKHSEVDIPEESLLDTSSEQIDSENQRNSVDENLILENGLLESVEIKCNTSDEKTRISNPVETILGDKSTLKDSNSATELLITTSQEMVVEENNSERCDEVDIKAGVCNKELSMTKKNCAGNEVCAEKNTELTDLDTLSNNKNCTDDNVPVEDSNSKDKETHECSLGNGKCQNPIEETLSLEKSEANEIVTNTDDEIGNDAAINPESIAKQNPISKKELNGDIEDPKTAKSENKNDKESNAENIAHISDLNQTENASKEIKADSESFGTEPPAIAENAVNKIVTEINCKKSTDMGMKENNQTINSTRSDDNMEVDSSIDVDKEITEKADMSDNKTVETFDVCDSQNSNNCDDSPDVIREKTSEKHVDIKSEVEEKTSTISELSKQSTMRSMLANNMVIFSDEEDEPCEVKNEISSETSNDKVYQTKECVSLSDDDDDIMVIDDDTRSKNKKSEKKDSEKSNDERSLQSNTEPVSSEKTKEVIREESNAEADTHKPDETKSQEIKTDTRPLVATDFLKNFKNNMTKMNRSDLEEFCLLKIVEGVIDRSNLSEIKVKLKTMIQNVEEWKKKAMVLNKQNRDLQIVLRTVQEEQKKRSNEIITPLKITRSVGMQVLMSDQKNGNLQRARGQKRNLPNAAPPPKTAQPKQPAKQVKIPVPRLVPASSPTKPTPAKPSPQLQNSTVTSNSGTIKTTQQNAARPNPPTKTAEKRTFSDAIDLTDDEPNPPAKKAPVRLVPSQQLMAPGRTPVGTPPKNSNPRQVYIPIGNQNSIRPGQTLFFKGQQPARARAPAASPSALIRASPAPRSAIRPQNKHPAPLPQTFSQPQPPNWKALPPAPDLKISKIENGIVVSWKIDGYQESSYEEIVSYQLYAYQETSAPASTVLWNKIGDIKALPLPMACTLTQFIAGYKYYFAVRAVDIRSRIGPFSLPGSILLLNK